MYIETEDHPAINSKSINSTADSDPENGSVV